MRASCVIATTLPRTSSLWSNLAELLVTKYCHKAPCAVTKDDDMNIEQLAYSMTVGQSWTSRKRAVWSTGDRKRGSQQRSCQQWKSRIPYHVVPGGLRVFDWRPFKLIIPSAHSLCLWQFLETHIGWGAEKLSGVTNIAAFSAVCIHNSLYFLHKILRDQEHVHSMGRMEWKRDHMSQLERPSRTSAILSCILESPHWLSRNARHCLHSKRVVRFLNQSKRDRIRQQPHTKQYFPNGNTQQHMVLAGHALNWSQTTGAYGDGGAGVGLGGGFSPVFIGDSAFLSPVNGVRQTIAGRRSISVALALHHIPASVPFGAEVSGTVLLVGDIREPVQTELVRPVLEAVLLVDVLKAVLEDLKPLFLLVHGVVRLAVFHQPRLEHLLHLVLAPDQAVRRMLLVVGYDRHVLRRDSGGNDGKQKRGENQKSSHGWKKKMCYV
nr:hypothetical protein Iba_chr01aCG18050 [Ipomoea batatas]